LNKQSGDKLLFINAWNEWGEGNHLEPDIKFGYSYLEATRRALSDFDSGVFFISNADLHLKKKIEYLENELEKRNQRISVLMNSYSWKMTEPLRNMHKLYKNLKKN